MSDGTYLIEEHDLADMEQHIEGLEWDMAIQLDIIWEIFHRGHGLTIPTDIIIRMIQVLERK